LRGFDFSRFAWEILYVWEMAVGHFMKREIIGAFMDAIATYLLTKVYRGNFGRSAAPSLNRLSLSVEEHEVFGFLGKNGAGKTTTIKILCSLLRPTQWAAFIFGENVRSRKARRLIGYLPESPYFYEYLTPRETIDFYGRLSGLNARQRRQEWDRLAALLDLGPIANQRIRSFSKGMRQRLGFAVALVDEPMTGLDPLGRRSIRELIVHMHSEEKTIFFSSHVLGDVEQICDRVGILVNGELRSQGRLDELLTRRINQVEIVVEGVDGRAGKQLAPLVESTRTSEAGLHLFTSNLDDANAAVKAVHEQGGRVVEFTPIKESLEDYFMRELGGEQ
jgi:ABC-2 type transport system ATP-binding protein